MTHEDLITNDPDDDLGPLLRRHVAARLDPHLGGAARAFAVHRARHVAHRLRLVRAVAALATTAAAAAAAIAFFPRHHPAPAKDETVTAPVAARPGSLQEVVWSRTIDQGVVYLDDDTPARKLLRQRVRELRWTDASGSHLVEAAAPENEVMLISLDKF